jgi:hypothetical protein
MTAISDDYMRRMIATTKSYCIVLLKAGPNRTMPGGEQIVWEHARRNFSLRSEGKLPIVCPVDDGSELCGLGIFNASIDEVRSTMEPDPAILQEIFTYELHACRSFPGDRLPG